MSDITRQTATTSITVQLANPFQPAQFGVSVYSTTLHVLTDEKGSQVGNPTQTMMPLIKDDINDQLLKAINQQLESIGLVATRIETAA